MVDSCTAAHGECLFHDSNFTVIVPVKSFRRLSVAGRTYILSKFAVQYTFLRKYQLLFTPVLQTG